MSYAAWLQQAESDLQAAEALSYAGLHSQAVWLAAQSVEKAHKAILVALGLRYEEKHFKQMGHKTSEIAGLIPTALHEPLDLEIASLISTFDALAIASRYPAPAQKAGRPAEVVAPAVSIGSSHQNVVDAKRLVEWCRERIGRALKAVEAMKPSSVMTETAKGN
jgi:HEPN domain-containing protein